MIEIWCPEMLATEKHGNIDLHYSIGGLKKQRAKSAKGLRVSAPA
jgi:hypothetical protein